MTTKILRNYDMNCLEYLETLIEVNFKTVGEVVRRERTIKKMREQQIQKIANLISNIGSGSNDK